MKQHRYRITLEHLSDAQSQPPAHAAPLQFEIGNHDDLFAIVARMQARDDFDADAAAALGVGLKLLGEVMLTHPNHPLFTALRPHFTQFIKALKKGPTAP